MTLRWNSLNAGALSRPPVGPGKSGCQGRTRVLSLCLLGWAATVGSSPVAAEVLCLKNGKRILVDRFWEQGEQIFYEWKGGIFGFPRALLLGVERGQPIPTAGRGPAAAGSPAEYKNVEFAQALEAARQSAGQGRIEEASRHYQQALAVAPESIPGRVELAELYLRRGELQGAQAQLEQAKRAAPDEPTVRELLGEVYRRRGRGALAIREWQRALELAPTTGLLEKLKEVLRENQEDIDFDEIRRPHFLIRYDGAVNEAIGREIAAALEQEYGELVEEFLFTPSAPLQVTLYTNREFLDLSGAPSWVSALNDGEIRIPLQGVERLDEKVRRLLRHEITHSFVNTRTGNNCPAWFQEGLAQIRAGAAPPDLYERLRAARASGGLLPLWSLEGPLLQLSADEARLAYLESLAATQYLVERRGRQALVEILDLLSERRNMNDALTDVVGLDYQNLQTAWEADLSRFRPRP